MNANRNARTLRERRLDVAASQEALARAAGVSLHTYRLYEAGYRPEAGDSLERIHRALEEIEEATDAKS